MEFMDYLECCKSFICIGSYYYKYMLLFFCYGFNSVVNGYMLVIFWFMIMGIIVEWGFYNIKFIRSIVFGCKIMVV